MKDDTETMFHLYGDESTNGSIVSYGVIVVKPFKEQLICKKLKEIKEKHGVFSGRLHCKELLHDDKRKKTTWAHLTATQCLEIYGEVINTFLNDITFLGAYADTINIPDLFPKNENDQTILNFDINMGIKQITILLASIVQEPFIKKLGTSYYKFWADPDRSKIQWLNKNSQAIRALDGIYFGLPGTPQTKVQFIDSPYSELLELSDLLAFSIAHYFSKTKFRYKEEIIKLCKLMNPSVGEAKMRSTSDGSFEALCIKPPIINFELRKI